MIELLMQYGLFLAKAITIVIAVGLIASIIIGSTRRERSGERLEITNLNRKYEGMTKALRRESLPKKAMKQWEKSEKAKKKKEDKQQRESTEENTDRRVFVLDFDGDIKATGVSALREEITAILGFSTPKDEVVVRLENAGGVVHEHGFAASQLMRIRQRKIPLTVIVDKVAASGGYMMACVADRIIAAPFAVIGSIGVIAQLPNFHRLLNKHGIDFEQIKAGDFKRTVTFFGENTDKDREKLKEEIEDTHELFKGFVEENRPELDIAKISTGEHWYGTRALELKLVDELMTSDDYLLAASEKSALYEVCYTAKKSVGERIAAVMQGSLEKLFSSWWRFFLSQR
uniref:Inner membrane peptidase. Serine peptidase. MEROPS family S49 n=1 Tax=Candidatus Kentrum sp. TUN TaxID=2126343 RepID=A0A450ZCD8_9GAMM|nr:MAG: inner membrane peptidase. Serine peptidase. MEROPS family S49 [Candidatus Kentron sp. TUN]VFK57257.1 MAG: inner membrane peptidase. Serine peptidase. MEROPS family S49 [Candidatus Kentron sp. TUN]VFK65377.1 MAG: inner membrane peptidase. Serine peptidase. MEROPS family S49 [Candidatus Kentron sp. TUN]